jgi:hypothetical protein
VVLRDAGLRDAVRTRVVRALEAPLPGSRPGCRQSGAALHGAGPTGRGLTGAALHGTGHTWSGHAGAALHGTRLTGSRLAGGTLRGGRRAEVRVVTRSGRAHAVRVERAVRLPGAFDGTAGAPLRSTRRPAVRPVDPCRRPVGHFLRPRRDLLPGPPRTGVPRLTSTLLLEAGVDMTGTGVTARPRALLLRRRRLRWLLRLLFLGHVHHCAVPA